MIVFLKIVLCFFALVGAGYLLRDAFRLGLARRGGGAKFFVVYSRRAFEDERAHGCALLSLGAFLSRPEARHLIRKVLVTDTAPHELGALYEAAKTDGVDLESCTEEELILLLRDG